MKKIHLIQFLFLGLLFYNFKNIYLEKDTLAPKELLSEYDFFVGNIKEQLPHKNVLPYALNTPLFSDYAEKLRFIALPQGAIVAYNATEVLDFPKGTTIIKTFYFPNDFRDASKGRRLLETRLLVHTLDGWKAYSYVWNDEQTDATLEVAGDLKNVTYTYLDGKKREQEYVIPNLNQCKGCHNKAEKMTPIGPSIRLLNGDFDYATGKENQLQYWKNKGILIDLPDLKDCPKSPVWNKPETGSIADRARTWLDINCAHCHNPQGPALTSGLNLSVWAQAPTAIGILKSPVAAGRGSGNRAYDIVPGNPDKSILIYRMESTDPGVMMPEIGRRATHKEGIALVREWIKSMK